MLVYDREIPYFVTDVAVTILLQYTFLSVPIFYNNMLIYGQNLLRNVLVKYF